MSCSIVAPPVSASVPAMLTASCCSTFDISERRLLGGDRDGVVGIDGGGNIGLEGADADSERSGAELGVGHDRIAEHDRVGCRRDRARDVELGGVSLEVGADLARFATGVREHQRAGADVDALERRVGQNRQLAADQKDLGAADLASNDGGVEHGVAGDIGGPAELGLALSPVRPVPRPRSSW